MDLLRRFALVGLIATAVDVIALLALREQVGLPIWIADSLAVALATAVSWVLHGLVSFPDDPARRWYNRPAQYVRASAVSLLADVFVLSLLYELLHPEWWGALLVIKLPALMVAFILRLVMYRESMFVTVRQDQKAPNPRIAAAGQVRLSVVVPAYGEADRIADSVQRIRSALSSIQSDGGLQIVVVDDGSSDATAAEAERAGADLVLKQEVNAGKGSAVRAGMLAATGRVVAFTDADLSYAPEQLLLLLDGVEQGWDVVVGSRQHVETQTVVRAGRIREVGGRIINVLTGLVLLGRYRDTQCGLKAMRADVGRLIFSHAKIDGFAFDVEVFALVERYRLTLHEVPVEVQNSERSTVNVARDAFRLIRDLFRIRRWGRLGQYEVDPAEFPEAGAQA